MSLKHRVCISVSRSERDNTEILRSGSCRIRSRILSLLFGEKVGVFVITPGKTVETVEIREIAGGKVV
jgi:hypothetical protein